MISSWSAPLVFKVPSHSSKQPFVFISHPETRYNDLLPSLLALLPAHSELTLIKNSGCTHDENDVRHHIAAVSC